jgi:hypothetical protein
MRFVSSLDDRRQCPVVERAERDETPSVIVERSLQDGRGEL